MSCFSTLTFGVSLLFTSVLSGSYDRYSDEIGNGCSPADIAWFNNIGSEFQDLVTRSQNSGNGNSDEFITFVKCNFLSTFNYTVYLEETGQTIAFWSTPDELLTGGGSEESLGLVADLTALLGGRIWLWGSAGAATCYDDGSATWIFRSGDNIRGDDGINFTTLDRTLWSFVKVDSNSDSSDSGYYGHRSGDCDCSEYDSIWKVNEVIVETIAAPFVVYAAS